MKQKHCQFIRSIYANSTRLNTTLRILLFLILNELSNTDVRGYGNEIVSEQIHKII